MSDLEKPMGNTELRLTLSSIQEEIGDVKSIALDTRDQARKTNGRVNMHDKLLWLAMGALPLLTAWAGWLTLRQLENPSVISRADVQAAVQQAFAQNLKELK